MDLKKYRKHIASRLLDDIRVQANKAKSIENGLYHPNKQSNNNMLNMLNHHQLMMLIIMMMI